jgi:hypothetical protein
MELGSVFQGLSAAASIVSAFKAALDIRNELSRSDVERIAADAQRHSLAVYQKAIIAAQKIRGLSDAMIETIRKKVEQAQRDWQDKIDNGTTGSFAQATDKLRSECCALLRQMKQLNGGTLPDEWYDIWADMQCA